MSDQPGIPAITVFPPFNPAPRQSDPAPRPVQDEAPTAPAEAPAAPAVETWDSAPPAAPLPWDFEAPAPAAASAPAEADDQAAVADAPAPSSADGEDDDADEHGDAPVSDEEDLPWLEVPTPRPQPSETAQPEIKAEDRPNFADWMRTEDQAPAPEAEAEATPVEELQADEAEDAWTDGVAEADGAWRPPSEAGAEAWEAPAAAAPEPWVAPQPDLEVPQPELYDLPEVSADAAADAAADDTGWELPAAGAADAAAAPPGPVTADPFAAVADRLQQIAEALRRDPQGFATGAASADDPLASLVAGFVLGYQAALGS